MFMNTKCNIVRISIQGIPKWGNKIFYSSTSFFWKLPLHSNRLRYSQRTLGRKKKTSRELALMILRLGTELVSKTKVFGAKIGKWTWVGRPEPT